MWDRLIRLVQRILWVAAAVAVAIVVGIVALTMRAAPVHGPNASPQAAPPHIAALPIALAERQFPRNHNAGANCQAPPAFAQAARANGVSMTTLPVAPFGVAETGWEIYQPLIAREIGTGCTGDSALFASRLGAWQGAHRLAASGLVDAATLKQFALVWLLRRPFVVAMRHGCPPSPDPATLATASAQEAYGGKVVLARPAALAAYRRLLAAARQDGVAPSPLLRVAGAWRGPDEEAARCADGSCGTAAKARCSAHRTGLAFDFWLGAAAGSDGFSASAANRLWLSRTATYRWLVAHGDQFGFVNYPFEPWHWEWTGENI